jgi:hypothetical protein
MTPWIRCVVVARDRSDGLGVASTMCHPVPHWDPWPGRNPHKGPATGLEPTQGARDSAWSCPQALATALVYERALVLDGGQVGEGGAFHPGPGLDERPQMLGELGRFLRAERAIYRFPEGRQQRVL